MSRFSLARAAWLALAASCVPAGARSAAAPAAHAQQARPPEPPADRPAPTPQEAADADLVRAAMLGDLAGVKSALGKGARITATADSGGSAVAAAAAHGDT